MSATAKNSYTVVLGLGATGVSAARYLSRKGYQVRVLDSRPESAQLIQKAQQLKEVLGADSTNLTIEYGPLDSQVLCAAREIIISPGLSRKLPAVQQAIDAGVSVVGDVELFAREVSAPIVAITGSNGKTTVTTLLGEMARHSGIKTVVAGNIGLPVLDTLDELVELYILELSSFQLESTYALSPKVATVLNVSADHMDRYDSLNDYAQTKHRIALGAQVFVQNKDDLLATPAFLNTSTSGHTQLVSFTLSEPNVHDYGVRDGYIVKGNVQLVATSDLKIKGLHNSANAAAALALADAAGLPKEKSIQALKAFSGLPHRCESVAVFEDVTFINDSKATNIGATLAALEGFKPNENELANVHVILGGDGKGADFTPLIPTLSVAAKSVVTMGKDGVILHRLIQSSLPALSLDMADTLVEAIQKIVPKLKAGDIVLLSPACASLDMYKSFEARGEAFKTAVKEAMLHECSDS